MNAGSLEAKTQRFSYRNQERGERRRRILETAEGLFSTLGYHESSIAQIARTAGFAVGTIYLYFDDKADLYGSVLIDNLRQMVENAERALTADAPAPECLRAAVHLQFAFHDTHGRFYEIFLNQHQIQSSELSGNRWGEMESLKRAHLTLIENCIVRGQAAGQIKPGNPRLYAVTFLGMVLQNIRQYIRDQRPGLLEDSADFVADCFLLGTSAPRGEA